MMASIKINDAELLMKKYPTRIPCIIKSHKNIHIEKTKYLVPETFLMREFMYILKKSIKMKHSDALFVIINNTMPRMTFNMREIYTQHHSPDGFLYIDITLENTFGFIGTLLKFE